MARYETIRAFLACSEEEEMHVHQMDVETAYLRGGIEHESFDDSQLRRTVGMNVNEE